MNHKPPVLDKSTAIQGFLQYKSAEGLSARTIEAYTHDLHLWVEIQGDSDVFAVSFQELRQYIAFLLTDYKPRRIAGSNGGQLSPKTVRNQWVSLCAFFHWFSDEFQCSNPMKNIPAPKFTYAPVEPFTKEEVELMLKACNYSNECQTNNRRKFSMRRPTALRDMALILVLLDTGLRASKLCALLIGDLEVSTGKLVVKHGSRGGAKGSKGRIVYLGKATRRTLWRYIVTRDDSQSLGSPLFLGYFNRPLNRDALRQLIKSIGDRAGVKKAHPHRFRHTFAITYLRSGGDLFKLQALPGHSTLNIVQLYARVAQIYIQDAHRRSSPVDNWRL